MCRIFAQLSTAPRSAAPALLSGARSLSALSRRHSDGWGLAASTPRGVQLFKSPRAACDDPHFDRLARITRAPALLAHVRKATVGAVRRANAHPFRWGRWMFAHNGSVFGFEDLRPRIAAATPRDLARRLRGSTDSEALFYYLLGAMRGAGLSLSAPVQPRAASGAIRQALGRIFAWADALSLPPPKVSFVLTDGRHLLAQRGGMELHLSASAGVLRVSSEPVDDQRWLLIPEGCMVVGTPSRILHLTRPPDGFRVTWPAPLSPPPERPNVSRLAA